MLSTWFEVDVTTTEFRHLIEQKDIFDHRETPRKVWMLVESDGSGVAIHIFPSNPVIELAQRPESGSGILTRLKTWFKSLVPCLAKKPSPVRVPYIPYEMAIIGIQIEIYQNAIKSVVWNPVPGEDDFQEDPDAPPNPTVEVLIDDVDSYLLSKEQDDTPFDGTPKEPGEDDELDLHPF